MKSEESDELQKKVTDVDALADNASEAAIAFAQRWMPMPSFTEHCEVMDVRQLRDAMGLRVTDAGDPWPAVEQYLLSVGFRWHWLGTARVMFLQEKDDWEPDDGWEEVESDE